CSKKECSICQDPRSISLSSLCLRPSKACYLMLFSARSFHSFRLAAESFCIKYSLSPPTPRTSSIGDCWLCRLSRMDASRALWIARIWREIYRSFLKNKKQNYNCYLIKSECYSSFMFNLN
uniref:Uncharacterized protein n=1 Tax=Mus spicilegus TaxID=10103 RepID=A0A8C6N472_MUSSI